MCPAEPAPVLTQAHALTTDAHTPQLLSRAHTCAAARFWGGGATDIIATLSARGFITRAAAMLRGKLLILNLIKNGNNWHLIILLLFD